MHPLRLPTLAAALLATLAAGGPAAAEAARPQVVATTAMLAAAVRTLAPADAVALVELQPPGACPGHFDVTPGQLRQAKEAALVLYHDFQDGLAQRLGRTDAPAGRFVRIPAAGSLCLPEYQLALLEQVAAALAGVLDEPSRGRLAARHAAAKQAVDAVAAELAAAARRWAGRPVVASAMQRDLAARLGLRVVGELQRPEELGPREWQALRAAKAQLVLGNLQSDAAAAERLATQAGLPVAVLSNFPGADGYGADYPTLLRANLARIATAWNER